MTAPTPAHGKPLVNQHHPANALFHALNKIAQAPLPTWADYQSAPEGVQASIRERWCSIGHGYRGDGSQREEAFRLYCRATTEKFGPAKRHPSRVGDAEEYEGEASDRGLDHRGFNDPREMS